MNDDAGPSDLGHTLARFGPMRMGNPDAGAPVLTKSRLGVLRVLEAAERPQTIADISEATGLHANTIRGHIDALMAAGRVARLAGPRGDRGRPLWLYSAQPGDTLSELALVLTEALELATAPELARTTAESWAETLPDVARAESVDAAVDSATEAMTRLGFDAVRNEVGDELSLRACPYASLVRDHPVICDVHAALLSQLLQRTGQPITVTALEVFPKPTVCVARLARPDTAPEWVVTMEESA